MSAAEEQLEAMAMVKRLSGKVKELTTCLAEATVKVAELKDELHQVKLDATKTIGELNIQLMMAEGPL